MRSTNLRVRQAAAFFAVLALSASAAAQEGTPFLAGPWEYTTPCIGPNPQPWFDSDANATAWGMRFAEMNAMPCGLTNQRSDPWMGYNVMEHGCNGNTYPQYRFYLGALPIADSELVNFRYELFDYRTGNACENLSPGGIQVTRARPITCPPGTSWDNDQGHCAGFGQDKNNNSCELEKGDPVHIKLGFVRERETDFELPGELTVRFTRHYSSSPNWLFRGAMGVAWRHSYERSVTLIDTGTSAGVWVQRGDGDRYLFRRQPDGAFLPDHDIDYRLTRLSDAGGATVGWQLVDLDDATESYDATGRLTSIRSRSGRRLTFAYQAQKLESITTDQGRRIRLHYFPPILESTQQGPAGLLESVELPDGRIFRYTYREFPGLEFALERVTFPDDTPSPSDNPRRTFIYGEGTSLSPRRLTGVVDEREARVASWRYDPDGRVDLNTRGPIGTSVGRVEFSYELPGARSQVTETVDAQSALVSRTEYSFSTILETVKLIESSQPCLGCGSTAVKSRSYDTKGYLDVTTDFRGVETDHDYDLDGRGLEHRKDEARNRPTERRITETAWHPLFRLPVERLMKDGVGAVKARTVFSYTARGQLQARCEYDSGVAAAQGYSCGALASAPPGVRQTRFEYHQCSTFGDPDPACPFGSLLKQVDGPRTDVVDTTRFEYRTNDAPVCGAVGGCAWRRGDLWKVINALGHVTETMVMDRSGRPVRIRDENGTIHEMTYHVRGGVASRTVRASASGQPSPGDATTLLAYDAAGNLVAVTEPDGSALTYVYDDAGRLTEVRNALGERLRYTLDDAGNRRREETLDPHGSVRRVLARQFDALKRIRSLVHAPHANAADLDAPAVKKTRYAYDLNSNVDQVTDAVGSVSDQDHDALDRLVRSVQDIGGIGAETRYAYDTLDRLIEVVDPKSLSTRYEYDGLGNLSRQISPDTGTTQYSYDAAGNRLSATDARGITATHTYDALNRLQSITYSTPGHDVSYAYDLPSGECDGLRWGVGRLSRITDRAGSTSYCYDHRGNMRMKVQSIATSSARFTLGTQYAYDLADRLVSITYPGSGKSVSYVRDGAGRVAEIKVDGVPVVTQVRYRPFGPAAAVRFADGSEIEWHHDQNYWPLGTSSPHLADHLRLDDLGNPTALGRTPGFITSAEEYAYDALSRLTQVQNHEGAGLEAFSYDATGNRLSHTRTGTMQSYNYPLGSHRLASVGGVSRAYDAMGNTTQIGATIHTYDVRGRLAQVGSGPVMLYNGQGERVAVGDRAFVYHAPGVILGEYTQSRSALESTEYIWLDQIPVGLITAAGAVLQIHADHLGTPRAVASGPNASNRRWQWSFAANPFGQRAANEDPAGSGSPLEFRLRFPGQYYDGTGLHYNYFRDYEPGTGRYGESDPIGLDGGPSTYAYVGASPLTSIDPKGLLRVKDCPECDPGDVEDTRNSAKLWCAWASRGASIKDVAIRSCVKKTCQSGAISCKSDCKPRRRCGLDVGIPRGYYNPNEGAVICLNQAPARGGRGSTVIHEIAHSCGWRHGDGGGVPNDPGPDLPCETQP